MKRLLLLLLLAVAGTASAGFRHAQSSSGWVVDWDAATMQPSAQWVPVGSASAGNAGFSTATGTLTAAGTAKYPLPNGNVIDVQAKVIPTGPSVGAAVVNFAKKTVFPLQVGLAVYDLAKELGFTMSKTSSGEFSIVKDIDTSTFSAMCQGTTYQGTASSLASTCASVFQANQRSSGYPSCVMSGYYNADMSRLLMNLSNCSSYSSYNVVVTRLTTSTGTEAVTEQQFIDAIAAKSGWPSSSALSRAVADAVASGQPLPASTPTLSGPTTATGPSTTKTEVQKDAAGNPVGTKTITTNNTYNISYTNNEIRTTTITSTTTTNPDGTTTESTSSQAEQTDGVLNDSPMPDVPTLYEKKYPNGLEGVWAEKKAELTSSPLLNLLSGLMPSVGSSGTCPTMVVPLDVGIADFGSHDFAPPCWIWDFGRVVIIVSALLLARRLIFGG